MNNLRTHLWREWREHRRTLGLLAVCLTVLVAGLTQVVPEDLVGDPLSLLGVVGLTVAGVVISVGADLFASERQRGTDAFLARVPGALAGAFRAKLAFYLALSGGALIFGVLLVSVATLARLGSVPATLFEVPDAWAVALIGTALLWIFAISTWVKTSALTIPTAALFLCGAAWPGWLMVVRGREYRAGVLGSVVLLALAAVGALLTARQSFVGGRRPERSRRRALFASIVAATLSFTPAWAWVSQRYVSLQETMPKIRSVFIGEGSRHAYVVVDDEAVDPRANGAIRRQTALLLDLREDGASLASTFEDSFWSPSPEFQRATGLRASAELPLVDLVMIGDRGSAKLPLMDLVDIGDPGPFLSRRTFDGATGSVFDGVLQERVSEARAAMRFPEEVQPDLTSFLRRAGTGYTCRVGRRRDSPREPLPRYSWDPATGVVVESSRIHGLTEEESVERVIVRPGRWMAYVMPSRGWTLFDPLSLALGSSAHLEPEDKLCDVFADGSLLVARRKRAIRIFPETGEVHEWTLIGGGLEDNGFVYTSIWGGALGTPLSVDEPSVVNYSWTIVDGRPALRPAILDPVASTVEVLDIRSSSLVTGPGFALVVEREQRLLRIDARTGATTLLLDLGDTALDVDG